MRTRSHRPRIRGTKPAPIGRLTPPFADVVRSSGHAKGALSAVAGFTKPSHFSTLLYADFPLTPLVVRRLSLLAAALDFAGEVVEPCR